MEEDAKNKDKKPKKAKKKQTLSEFLDVKKPVSWADDDSEFFPVETSADVADDWRKSNIVQRRSDVQHKLSNLKPPFTLKIGNLAYSVNETDLVNFFCLRDIKTVRLAKDGSGSNKGFAFVEFSSKDDLFEALKKDGQALKNREIRLEIAESKGRPRSSEGTDTTLSRDFMGMLVLDKKGSKELDRNAFGTDSARPIGLKGRSEHEDCKVEFDRNSFGSRETIKTKSDMDRGCFGSCEQETTKKVADAFSGRECMGSSLNLKNVKERFPPQFSRDSFGAEKPLTKKESSNQRCEGRESWGESLTSRESEQLTQNPENSSKDTECWTQNDQTVLCRQDRKVDSGKNSRRQQSVPTNFWDNLQKKTKKKSTDP